MRDEVPKDLPLERQQELMRAQERRRSLKREARKLAGYSGGVQISITLKPTYDETGWFRVETTIPIDNSVVYYDFQKILKDRLIRLKVDLQAELDRLFDEQYEGKMPRRP